MQDGVEEKKSLIPADNVEAIAQFVHHKSSLSLIHYFNERKEEQPEDKPKAKEKELADEEVEEAERCVCELHRDTGLMTIGVCSDVVGLQVRYTIVSMHYELN